MFSHYLSTALRHFRRFKIATTINVVCLALGIACLVLTYAVVNVLAQSDAHFAKAARIQVIPRISTRPQCVCDSTTCR